MGLSVVLCIVICTFTSHGTTFNLDVLRFNLQVPLVVNAANDKGLPHHTAKAKHPQQE